MAGEYDMGLLVYDMNSYVKNELPAPYTNIEIFPMVGYSEVDPPFILYDWFPSKVDVERYYMRRDFIMYNIYDRDAARLFDLVNEMEKILNLSDQIQGLVSSSTNRVLWCDWRGGTPTAPITDEGFYKVNFEVWVGYVPL